MAHVTLQAEKVIDWDSFHDLFAETFGFPDFYGRNMDAWIDLMSSLDDSNAPMSTVRVAPGELLHLKLMNSSDLQKRLPNIFGALIDCTAAVNTRNIAAGRNPILALILC